MNDHDCIENDKVLDSRPRDGFIVRRRECQVCQRRFNTVELVVPDGANPTQWGAAVRRRGLDRKRITDCLVTAEAFVSSLRKSLSGDAT